VQGARCKVHGDGAWFKMNQPAPINKQPATSNQQHLNIFRFFLSKKSWFSGSFFYL